MAYLVLVRHGETDWNAEGLFTGQTDIPLNDRGKEQAKYAAYFLRDIKFNSCYASNLSRSKDTLHYLIRELNLNNTNIIEAKELTERNYGMFEGKSKKEVIQKYGKDWVHKLRRSWNYPVPNGETLKAVYERVVPYYQEHILADLKDHKNVLVAGHNNTIRVLIKYLENLSEEELENFELGNGEVYIYEIGNNGKVTRKKSKVRFDDH